MKNFISSFCIITFQFLVAQKKEKVDSVIIYNYRSIDKETSTMFDNINKDTIIMTGKWKLSNNEILEINKNISKSINKRRSLLSNSDISINYYYKNINTKSIIVSTLTNNISINSNYDKKLDVYKSVRYGKISNSFLKYLKNIIKNRKHGLPEKSLNK